MISISPTAMEVSRIKEINYGRAGGVESRRAADSAAVSGDCGGIVMFVKRRELNLLATDY